MKLNELSQILIELLHSESAQADENNQLVLNNMLATLQSIATVTNIVKSDPLDDEYKQDMLKVSEELEKFFVESTISRLKEYGVIVDTPKLKKISKQNKEDSFQMGMNYGYGMPYLGYPYSYGMPFQPSYGMPPQPGYGMPPHWGGYNIPPQSSYGMPPQPNYNTLPQENHNSRNIVSDTPYSYSGRPITPDETETEIDKIVKKHPDFQPFVYESEEERAKEKLLKTETETETDKEETSSKDSEGGYAFDFSKRGSDGKSDQNSEGRDYLLSILEKRNTNNN